jgi:hypothetical protein
MLLTCEVRLQMLELWTGLYGSAVREGVSTDSLKFHLAPPCPTHIRPAGGPPPKRPSSSPLDTPSRTGLARGIQGGSNLLAGRLPRAVGDHP